MIKYLESIFYNTLEELNETLKSNNKDVLNLMNKYGDDIKISRIMHPKGINPRFELRCYVIC